MFDDMHLAAFNSNALQDGLRETACISQETHPIELIASSSCGSTPVYFSSLHYEC